MWPIQCPPCSRIQYPQYTTEWAIPFEQTSSCLNQLRDWLEQEQADPHGLRPHFPIEIRFSDADDVWLSPSFGRKTTWIGIVQYKYVRSRLCPFLGILCIVAVLISLVVHRPYGCNVPYRKLFERFEGILARHKGRPHWAKSHPLRPHDLRTLYPHFDDFVRVLEEVDPNGIFRNEYVERHIFDKRGPGFDGRVFKRFR